MEVDEEIEQEDDLPIRLVGLKTKKKFVESYKYFPKGTRQKADLEYFLERLREHLYDDLLGKMKRGGVRFGIAVKVKYYTPIHDRESTDWLRSTFMSMLHPVELEQTVDAQFVRIIHANANYCKDQTGNILDEIQEAVLEMTAYHPKPGGHEFVLPEKLIRRKAVVNIETNDGTCFGYAILASLYHPNRGQQNRKTDYNRYWYDNHLDEIQYPVELHDIPDIEQQLQVSINVYTYDDDECKMARPLLISRSNIRRHVDILYKDEHYMAIRSLERLCFGISRGKYRKWLCRRCLSHFKTEAACDDHSKYCTRDDFVREMLTMPKPGDTLKFRDWKALEFVPFVVYADFESLTVPIDEQRGEVQTYQEHVPCSVGWKLISRCISIPSLPYEHYTGPDCVLHFLTALVTLQKELVEKMDNGIGLVMRPKDLERYNRETICRFCKKTIVANPKTVGEQKVRDHDHLTGRFRGAAHSKCNLNAQQYKKLVVFLHNFRGYDSHLIVRAFRNFPDRDIKPIAQSTDRYLSITWGGNIIFKDTYQFMRMSLDGLVQCLAESDGGIKNFHYLMGDMNVNPLQYPLYIGDQMVPMDWTLEDVNRLLLKKGVYPYDYMDSWSRFNEQYLPVKEAFASKLHDSEIGDAEYERARDVWTTFKCNSFLDYHELYLKTDVLLLADLFENFRRHMHRSIRLDPAHYVSAPQTSWAAMLLHSHVDRPLNYDSEMYRMVSSGARGGVAVITKRHAKANNPLLGELYDPAQPTSWIAYMDANNLYG